MTEGRQPFTAEIKALAKGPSTYDPLENGIRPKRSLSRVAGRFNLNHDLAQRQSGPPRFAACEFRRNPAGDSDLKPATVPI
jgi:hypothetical protein